MDIPTVIIHGITIPVDVSKTKEEIKKGLSGRSSLDADKGMLFVFDHSAVFQFWMPDMHFSIDLIWIGSNMSVVDITPNAVPMPRTSKILFWKKPEPVWYRPSVPAQYVLEVNAGYAERHSILAGDAVQFVSI